jgi:DNA-binding transcriptional MerR regulator
MKLEAENLKVSITNAQELIIEPQYVKFLRENGFTIDGIENLHAIPSESDKEQAYLVGQIQTYTKPKDHPELDVIEDQITIPCCSCWSYRQNSNDVTEGKSPGGTCKHCKKAYRVAKAKQDDNQTELIE